MLLAEGGAERRERVGQLLAMQPPMSGAGDRTAASVDAMAERVRAVVDTALTEEIAQLDLPKGVKVERQGKSTNRTPPGWRHVIHGRQPAPGLVLRSDPPAKAELAAYAEVLVNLDLNDAFAFALFWRGEDDPLLVRVSDVEPTLSAMFDRRVRSWVRGHVAAMLSAFAELAQAALKASGYTV